MRLLTYTLAGLLLLAGCSPMTPENDAGTGGTGGQSMGGAGGGGGGSAGAGGGSAGTGGGSAGAGGGSAGTGGGSAGTGGGSAGAGGGTAGTGGGGTAGSGGGSAGAGGMGGTDAGMDAAVPDAGVDAGPSAPAGLRYSDNPAAYRAGVVIAPNTPSLDAGGLPVMFMVAPALPAGLALDSTSGVITGTPQRAGPSSTLRVTATSSAGSTGVDLSVSVGDAPRDFRYASSPGVYRGGLAITPVTPTLDAGWLPVAFAVDPDGGALPFGLTLNANTGVITGTPTMRAIDGGTVTIVASNDAGSATAAWQYYVFGLPSPFDYTDNVAYYQVGRPIRPNVPTPADVAGGLVFTASTTMPLPAGLTVNATTGIITGTPTTAQFQVGHTINKANPFGTQPCLVGIVISPAGLLTLTPGGAVTAGVSYAGPAAYDVTAQVTLVNDGTGDPTDACEAITNNVVGRIALATLNSTCGFRAQAGRAQAAGAVGILLADTVPAAEPPNFYDGSMLGVNIPIMSLGLSDATALRAALMNGPVTATMHRN